jgi:hypothetical protein
MKLVSRVRNRLYLLNDGTDGTHGSNRTDKQRQTHGLFFDKSMTRETRAFSF